MRRAVHSPKFCGGFSHLGQFASYYDDDAFNDEKFILSGKRSESDALGRTVVGDILRLDLSAEAPNFCLFKNGTVSFGFSKREISETPNDKVDCLHERSEDGELRWSHSRDRIS